MMKYLFATALALSFGTSVHAEGTLNLYVWADSISPALI